MSNFLKIFEMSVSWDYPEYKVWLYTQFCDVYRNMRGVSKLETMQICLFLTKEMGFSKLVGRVTRIQTRFWLENWNEPLLTSRPSKTYVLIGLALVFKDNCTWEE
jgi:hypothetical protein